MARVCLDEPVRHDRRNRYPVLTSSIQPTIYPAISMSDGLKPVAAATPESTGGSTLSGAPITRWALWGGSTVGLALLVWWILTQMSGTAFVAQILNGLSFGAVLFFLASGFTLIFGLMRITNLAHGGFYLVGGYIGITTVRVTGNFFVALSVSSVAIMMLGLFTERVLLRRIRGQEKPEVLLTIGLTFVLGDMALAIWGGDPTPIPRPDFLNGAMNFGGFLYP